MNWRTSIALFGIAIASGFAAFIFSLLAERDERRLRQKLIGSRKLLTLDEALLTFGFDEPRRPAFAEAWIKIGHVLHVDAGYLRPNDALGKLQTRSPLGALGESDLDDLYWEIIENISRPQSLSGESKPVKVETVGEALKLLMLDETDRE
ncbi:MAG: hypothetical protein P4L33_21190 [Capsulimonadaceae bacterium]|nr:hypothetical protein [Capsulimonadaceae bacterium]